MRSSTPDFLVESGNITSGGEDGFTTFNMMVNGTDTNMYTMNHVGTTFNEGGDADLDFRVESDGNVNGLYLDGGGNFIAMGNNAKSLASGYADQHGVGIDIQTGEVQISGDATPLQLGTYNHCRS
jgi:hypothetical protein